jgi:hypothetical protein
MEISTNNQNNNPSSKRKLYLTHTRITTINKKRITIKTPTGKSHIMTASRPM